MNYSLKKFGLTAEDLNVIDKITAKTKLESWLVINDAKDCFEDLESQNKKGEYKKLSPRWVLKTLDDVVDDPANYLTTEELLIYTNMMKKIGR